MKNYQYICIEGNIGAGKTSLTHELGKALQRKIILEEFENNPFLVDFYKEPEKYALSLELHFLYTRIKQLNEVQSIIKIQENRVVADYNIEKCLLYAQMNLKESDYIEYQKKFNELTINLIQPDFFIYLDAGLERLLQQIKQRGRSYEKGIKVDYLLNLKEKYERYLQGQQHLPVLWIETGNLDFVNNQKHKEELLRLINQEHILGITRISF